MPKVATNISVSLDGFVAGANDGPDNPMGDGGEQLHDWIVRLASWRQQHGLEGGETGPDSDVSEEMFRNVGAVVVGKRMFDNAGGWGEDPPFRVATFVLTHEVREPLVRGETTFTFVEGIERAVEQARAAAGDRDVLIGGGASTIQQALRAGLLDELHLHLVPLFLGDGVRLFEDLPPETRLEIDRVLESPRVTHVRYRVLK